MRENIREKQKVRVCKREKKLSTYCMMKGGKWAFKPMRDIYSVFQGFSKAKFTNGGSILSLSQFSILPQLAQKMKLALKAVKIDSKIIISLPKI